MEFNLRKMSPAEYEEYLDKLDEFTEKVNKKELTPRKFAYKTMEWGVKTIYGIDIKNTELSIGTLFDIFEKTVQMTEKSELDDEKNSEKSGSGESGAEQDSVKLAEKQPNSGAGN